MNINLKSIIFTALQNKSLPVVPFKEFLGMEIIVTRGDVSFEYGFEFSSVDYFNSSFDQSDSLIEAAMHSI